MSGLSDVTRNGFDRSAWRPVFIAGVCIVLLEISAIYKHVDEMGLYSDNIFFLLLIITYVFLLPTLLFMLIGSLFKRRWHKAISLLAAVTILFSPFLINRPVFYAVEKVRLLVQKDYYGTIPEQPH